MTRSNFSGRGFSALIIILLTLQAAGAEDPIFSGPQPGEKLPPFKLTGVRGDLKEKEFDFINLAEGKPVVLIFFHEYTRLAFNMARSLTRFYTSTRAEKGLRVGVVFLSDDPSEKMKWAQRVQKYFPEDVLLGISRDGREGPGAYGLNRKVTITILVGKEGKVTASFALIQPALSSELLEAIASVLGEKAPSLEDIQSKERAEMQRMREKNPRKRPQRSRPGRGGDAELNALLRALINKQATEAGVRETALKVEKYVDGKEAARKDLARRVTSIVNSGKLANYGTPAAQKVLRGWAKKYGEPVKDSKNSKGNPKRSKKLQDKS